MEEGRRREGERELERDEVRAALEVRHELGPAYEPAVVDALAERIEAVVAARVAADVSGGAALERRRDEASKRQYHLGVVSLVLGVPISAITAALADLPGLGVAWLGIAAVNAAHAAAVKGPERRR